MVAFARAKARSIFSKLRLTTISNRQIETHKKAKSKKEAMKEETNSNYFFEAIKSGGIWLS